MSRVLSIILILASALVFSGCFYDNQLNVQERAVNTAEQLLENANVNAGELTNTAKDLVDEVEEKSTLIPEVNINASIKKESPPRPRF